MSNTSSQFDFDREFPEAPDEKPEPNRETSWILWAIMLAVLIWGSLHAIGAFVQNPVRAIFPIVCTLGFLVFWLAMLRYRKRKLDREREEGKE